MKAWMTGACVALGLSTVAFAQQTQPSPTTPQRPTAAAGQPAQAGEQITLTGCVQREADYRKAQDAGRGGVAGTGVGAGNEFILAEAAPARTGAPAPTGTTGASATAYELTGPNEGKVAQFVGRRVEIVGMLKPADPAGGPTAGAPPAGVDVLSKDLKLREVEVTSVKEATGTCAAAARP